MCDECAGLKEDWAFLEKSLQSRGYPMWVLSGGAWMVVGPSGKQGTAMTLHGAVRDSRRLEQSAT